MNYFEAMQAVLDGEKVRKDDWHERDYLVLHVMPRKIGKKEQPFGSFQRKSGNTGGPLDLDIAGDPLEDCWEIYKGKN